MPLTYQEAVAAARGHVAYLNVTDPWFYQVYRSVPTEGVATDGGWFGGAPGFIVSAADGSVRVISWGEMADRNDVAG